jgi:F-type H+-transporting ATPase subunit delta
MALMTAAGEQKALESTSKDLEAIAAVLNGSRDFRVLVASPVVPAKRKSGVFKELFGPRVGRATLDFIDLLIEKHRERLLLDVIEQFNALHDEKLGIVAVGVTSAIECTAPQQKSLQRSLEQYTQKKVRVHFALDKTLKGGLLVRIGDTVLDASITHQLEVLRTRFVHGMDV